MRRILFSLLLSCIAVYLSTNLGAQHPTEAQTEEKSPDYANYLSDEAGARIHSCSSTDSLEWGAENIIATAKGTKGIWRTTPKKKFPHWVVIELPRTTQLTTFSFNTAHLSEDKFPGVTPRGVMIEFSNEGPHRGYRRVAHTFLAKKRNEQIVGIATDSAKWIRISLLNNFGNTHITELGRVYAYNDLVMNHFEMSLQAEHAVDLYNILFDSDSKELKKESLPVIQAIAEILERHPSWKIVVEGHTDKIGDASYNIHLSQQRANMVVEALVAHGIAPSRLRAKGFGASQPVIEGDSIAYAQNRRVTLRLSDE